MKDLLRKIRTPDDGRTLRAKLIISAAIATAGFLLGVFQKRLDSVPVNELPSIVGRIDLTNYFGRLGVWILIGTALSVYSKTPIRAMMNVFLFFISMVSGYYIYCAFVLGFLPRSYMLTWVAVSFAAPFAAFVCWYARGSGIFAALISAAILGVSFSQAFLIVQGFMVTHAIEVATWLAVVVILLKKKPKETALELGVSLPVAVIYQLLIPYWG